MAEGILCIGVSISLTHDLSINEETVWLTIEIREVSTVQVLRASCLVYQPDGLAHEHIAEECSGLSPIGLNRLPSVNSLRRVDADKTNRSQLLANLNLHSVTIDDIHHVMGTYPIFGDAWREVHRLHFCLWETAGLPLNADDQYSIRPLLNIARQNRAAGKFHGVGGCLSADRGRSQHKDDTDSSYTPSASSAGSSVRHIPFEQVLGSTGPVCKLH